MTVCPNCGKNVRHIRTLYVDALDDIVEVYCSRCGISTTRLSSKWAAA